MDSQFSYLYDKHELDNVGSNESYVDYNNGIYVFRYRLSLVLLTGMVAKEKACFLVFLPYRFNQGCWNMCWLRCVDCGCYCVGMGYYTLLLVPDSYVYTRD
jgi:hypothetical protein